MENRVCSLCGKPVGLVSKALAKAEVSHGACSMEAAYAARGAELPKNGLYGLAYSEAVASRAAHE